eukprot:g15352.t1
MVLALGAVAQRACRPFRVLRAMSEVRWKVVCRPCWLQLLSKPGMGKSEQAFFSALQASGINSAELTILLPSELLHTVLVPRGIMSEVAQRSGSRIDVGAEGPAKMLQVTLHGQMPS